MAMTMTTALSILLMVLQRILMGTDVVKNVNKNNASHAVLFEHWPRHGEARLYALCILFCCCAGEYEQDADGF
ncbi:hypothetical protein HPP92_027616 [Vanilla planifolia]|uniref:Secreted protein n=1 Tax=Vanilla planifolia TaxID=51239 RepID=A0A835PCB9_VANPL|nr:hypothetical protein HPP92_027616 [Vanilla planifolia]